MFRYEFKFDTEKAEKYGYLEIDLYNAVRKIMNKQGVFETSNGVFEYKNSNDSNEEVHKMFACFLRLTDSPELVHFCNYWGTYNEDEGFHEQHEIFVRCRNKVGLPCLEG